MNQKNGRTDPGPLRERARSLFISQATIDETLEWATPRQLDAIDRMLATEPANREASKRVCFVKFLWAVSAFLLVRLSGCF